MPIRCKGMRQARVLDLASMLTATHLHVVDLCLDGSAAVLGLCPETCLEALFALKGRAL